MLSIIGFYGEQGCGKSLACEIIHGKNRKTSIILPFSTPLLDAAKSVWGFDFSAMPTNGKNSMRPIPGNPMTARQLVQQLGTAIKTFDDKVFVRNLDERIADFVFGRGRENLVVLIPDVRFNVEYTYLKSRGAVFVKVVHPTNKVTQANNHESEQDWKTWTPDITIHNPGNKEGFRAALNEATLLGKWETYQKHNQNSK